MSITKKNSEELAAQIEKSVIDVILKSPLNIDTMPDDVEREMYENIFQTVEEFRLKHQNRFYRFICCKKT